MRMSAAAVYGLLPAIYRVRDAEEGYPLRELLGVIAEQAAVLEENIEQLYDDQFIETCADWVAPYLGGLIGYRPLHGATAAISSPRAEVANTIGYRRRLGTASVLEQLARDVTGWPARAVEYFLLCATTQRMNHIRPSHHFAPDLRDWRGLESLGTAFDPFSRTVDVRSIERADGRHNLQNVGIHLWRLQAQPRGRRTPAPATRLDDRRRLFSPLGAPLPLFSTPKAETRIAHLATPLNVPGPISRRVLHADLAGEDGAPPPQALYGRAPGPGGGEAQSLLLFVDGVEVPADEVEACNLSDDAGGWAHVPAQAGDPIAIDPVLGRIALPPDRTGDIAVAYHQGFSAEIGGGEYSRAADFSDADATHPRLRVPSADHPTIQSALDDLPATGGIVEIVDNGRYEEALAITAAAGAAIELRAADEFFPHLVLTADLEVRGGDDAAVTLDGLLVSGGAVTVPAGGGNALGRLTLRHCTLVPGRRLDAAGDPTQPGDPSVVVAAAGVALFLSACITGPLHVARQSAARVEDSIVDAAAAEPLDSAEGVAYAAPGGADFGGPLTLLQATVFGQLAAERFQLVSNSLLVARLAAGDPSPAAVRAERRQVGCMRFSFVPQGSLTPRRFRCQPQLAIDEAVAAREAALGGPVATAERNAIAGREARRVAPSFTARRYGRPAYAQLRASAPEEIRTGADDESEMGAFHLNYAPQREINLRIRLEEYLRFSLEAGVFRET